MDWIMIRTNFLIPTEFFFPLEERRRIRQKNTLLWGKVEKKLKGLKSYNSCETTTSLSFDSSSIMCVDMVNEVCAGIYL